MRNNYLSKASLIPLEVQPFFVPTVVPSCAMLHDLHLDISYELTYEEHEIQDSSEYKEGIYNNRR